MKKVYIIGTGGFAAEVTEYIYQNNEKQFNSMDIIGYFDKDSINYKKYAFEAPFLGNEEEFNFEKDANIIVAIGNQEIHKKVIRYIEENELNLINFIHYTVITPRNLTIGNGNILCPHVIIGSNTVIGNNNIFNYNTAIPHDCMVGHENIFSPNVQITGYNSIGNSNFFGVSCGTKPNIKIGDNNKIQAGIIVDKDIYNNNIVFTTLEIKKMELYTNLKGKQ